MIHVKAAARAMGCAFLDPVPQVLVYVSLPACVLAMFGLLRRLRSSSRSASR